MRTEKKKIAELTLCYCVAPLMYNGKRHFLVASEKEYACLLFDEHGNTVDKIWDGPGGAMSAVQLPGVDGAFLATQRMYSPNNCREAEIVLCRHEAEGWRVRTLAKLPGVHRFDILSSGGDNYLIACTIKSDYDCKDDWSYPGKVYACRLPEDLLSQPEDYALPLNVIKEGLTRNHGYSSHDGCGIVTADEGVFRFTPPTVRGGEWRIETLLNERVSDALLLDLDGDGADELLTLSPFHGDTLKIYRNCGGEYRKVYKCEKKLDFVHAVCPASLGGRELAVIGYRRGERELLAVGYRDGGYYMETLDRDVGPANVLSAEVDGKTVILSANREINEIAYYTVEEDN